MRKNSKSKKIEKNLYSNFIVGCLMLIKFKKTLDIMIDSKQKEEKKEN